MAGNSKMMLPTAGSTNWGSQLNGYLEWLDSRISNLSTSLSTVESGFVGGSGGGIAASGWTRLTKLKYNNGAIEVKGFASIGGYNIQENIEVDKSYSISSSSDITDGYYYLALYFNAEGNNLEFKVFKDYPWGILYILLGIGEVVSKQIKTFFPYIQTATTTLSQHKYNLDNLWANMDNVAVKVESGGTITVSGEYAIKGGYISLYPKENGEEDEGLFYGSPQEFKIAIKTDSNNIKYCEEYITYDEEDGTIKSKGFTPCSAKGSSNATSVIGRVLLDIFGNVVVVYSSAASISNMELEETANRILYNTQFLSLNDTTLYFSNEKTPIANRHFLELCRFGITNEAESGKYRAFNMKNEELPQGLYLAKSLNQGVMYQQSMNAWAPNTGTVDLSTLWFTRGNDATFTILPRNPQDGSAILYDGNLWNDEELAQVENQSCYVPLWEKHKTERTIALKTSNTISLTTTGTQPITLSSKDSIKLIGEDENSSKVYIGGSCFEYKFEDSHNESLLLSNKQGTATLELEAYYENSSGGNMVAIPPHGRIILKGMGNSTSPEINIGGYTESNEVKENITFESDDFIINKITKSGTMNVSLYPDVKFIAAKDVNGTGYMHWKFSAINIQSNDITLGPAETPFLSLKTSVATFDVDINLEDGKIIKYLSDRRLKENIVPLTKAYSDTILNTPIVSYNYLQNDDPQIGIVAQDLENALPENASIFVKHSKQRGYEDCRSIAETKLVYILWKGLQEEIQARTELERKLEKLLGDK